MKHAQKGFTLIELLISLGIGALFLAGLASSMAAIAHAQNLTRDYEQVQETLRFTTRLMARSLRTADNLDIKPAAISVASTKHFTVKREAKSDLVVCNGKLVPAPAKFHETYYQPDGTNKLVCQVTNIEASSVNWEGAETIAYGIDGFELECLGYDSKEQLTQTDYKSCESVTITELNKVIAVKITLKFDAAEFKALTHHPEHIFTVALRTNLMNLIFPEN